MIKRSSGQSPLTVCQVVASYQIEGTPELDIIDHHGRLYEGCSIVSLGGGEQDLLTIPAKGEEVLVFLDQGGAPYILGALGSQKRFVDEPVIDDAGEYDTRTIALKDAALLAGGARAVVSQDQDAVYLSPRVRVQGRLEVTNGDTPAQSLAVAEPLLETLGELRDSLEAVRSVVNIMGPFVQGLMSTAGNPQAAELTAALLRISSATPPARDTIASEIAKTER